MIPTLTTTTWAAKPGTGLHDGPTDLIPTPERRSATDLRDEYGPLLWEALTAFTQDASYLAEMCERANLIEWRQNYVPPEDTDEPLIDRLRTRTETTHDHWIWHGSLDMHGRPTLYHQRDNRSARAWWAEQAGLTGGRSRSCPGLATCVNPAHIYVTPRPKTPKVNTKRAPLDQAEYEAWLTDRYEVDGDHWMWKGHRDHAGPCFYRNGRRVTARLAVHELIKGHRPAQNTAGCQDRKTCVNPDHTNLREKPREHPWPPMPAEPPVMTRTDPPVVVKAPTPKATARAKPKPQPPPKVPANYLRERVEVDGDHLIWTGTMHRGRAVFEMDSRTYVARRVAWEVAYGTKPPHLSGTCGVEMCIAPAHSEPQNGERPSTVADILRTKVQLEDDHWIWTGAMFNGQAIINLNKKRYRIRREAWKSVHGDKNVPAKLTGTCGVERCIAPGHSRNGQAW